MSRRAKCHLQITATSHQHNRKSLFDKRPLRNRDLALSNIHRVRLGPGGYLRQVNKWQHEREAAIAARQPDPYQRLDDGG
jgi:hypothetical protein